MTDALSWADAQVAGARDDPAARLALMERLFRGPTGRAPRHLAAIRRDADTFLLVPRSQHDHRGRLPGARSARRPGDRPRALLHERCARPRSVRARSRRGGASCARTRGRLAASSAILVSEWSARSSRSAASSRIGTRSRATSSGTSPTSNVRPVARLRGDRAAPAARLRVVRGGARRTASARARSRRQPDLRLAVRAATRVAYRALAVPGRRRERLTRAR